MKIKNICRFLSNKADYLFPGRKLHKIILLFASLSLLMIQGLFAQQRVSQHHLNENVQRAGELQLLQQQADYQVQPVSRDAALHVIGNNNDTAVIIANPDKFQLKDDQKIAAMQTAEFITPVRNAMVMKKFDLKVGQGFVLPEVYYAKALNNNELLVFQILFINAGPMRLNMEKSVFQGTMQFLPVEVSSNGNSGIAPKALIEPLDIYVITPESKEKITLTQINWPPFDYTVQATRPMDTLEVKVSTIINPLGYKQVLKVEPAIEISAGSLKIQGLGIQTTPVYITLIGTSSSVNIPAALKVSQGYLARDTFNLHSNSIEKTELRSGGIGKASLSVFDRGYISNSIEIEYIFPWMFLLFSLGGGVLGSLVKVMKNKRAVKAKPLITGALMGFIVALCYWALGLKLLDISFNITYFNEFAVLALSILGGYIGLPDFKGLTKSTST
jgi:hypothetical protein